MLADRVRGTDAWVVFTAHSLPERILADGDPYRDQLLETSRLVAERAGLGERWSFAFQSASSTGEPWLGPDILDELERLHGEGVRKVLVASGRLRLRPSRDPLGPRRRGAREAAELGLELERIESLNDDPAFIRALAEIVEERLAVPGKSRRMSSRTCPDWPDLMEIAPELQFMHYTVAEAKLPSEALAELSDVPLQAVAICADLDHNVFYAHHTDPQVAEALSQHPHWFELREWPTRGPGQAA